MLSAGPIRLTAILAPVVRRFVFTAFRLIGGGAIVLIGNGAESVASDGVRMRPDINHNRVIEDLKLELIWIVPGTFTMGSPADEFGPGPSSLSRRDSGSEKRR